MEEPRACCYQLGTREVPPRHGTGSHPAGNDGRVAPGTTGTRTVRCLGSEEHSLS